MNELHTVTAKRLLEILPVIPDGLESKLLGALIDAGGHYVTKDYITDCFWGHREDGGPDDPSNAIWVVVCNLRKRIPSVHIENDRRLGYRIKRAA